MALPRSPKPGRNANMTMTVSTQDYLDIAERQN